MWGLLTKVQELCGKVFQHYEGAILIGHDCKNEHGLWIRSDWKRYKRTHTLWLAIFWNADGRSNSPVSEAYTDSENAAVVALLEPSLSKSRSARASCLAETLTARFGPVAGNGVTALEGVGLGEPCDDEASLLGRSVRVCKPARRENDIAFT